MIVISYFCYEKNNYIMLINWGWIGWDIRREGFQLNLQYYILFTHKCYLLVVMISIENYF